MWRTDEQKTLRDIPASLFVVVGTYSSSLSPRPFHIVGVPFYYTLPGLIQYSGIHLYAIIWFMFNLFNLEDGKERHAIMPSLGPSIRGQTLRVFQVSDLSQQKTFSAMELTKLFKSRKYYLESWSGGEQRSLAKANGLSWGLMGWGMRGVLVADRACTSGRSAIWAAPPPRNKIGYVVSEVEDASEIACPDANPSIFLHS